MRRVNQEEQGCSPHHTSNFSQELNKHLIMLCKEFFVHIATSTCPSITPNWSSLLLTRLHFASFKHTIGWFFNLLHFCNKNSTCLLMFIALLQCKSPSQSWVHHIFLSHHHSIFCFSH